MQTLYESWQLRRAMLEKSEFIDALTQDVHRRILDYLLSRYAGDPLGSAVAHFPARSELRICRRAMVVHEHVGRGVVSGVKTEAEATDRAARILKRIAKVDPQSSVQAPGHGIITQTETATSTPLSRLSAAGASSPAPGPRVVTITYQQRMAWSRIQNGIRSQESVDTILGRISWALSLGPTLPKSAIEFLFNLCDNPHYEDHLPATYLFRCNNTSAPEFAMIAWRNRIAAQIHRPDPDPVIDILRTVFLKDEVRKLALELTRPYLADVSAPVRVQSILLLGELGNVSDIGLLLDLSALPLQADEDPIERATLREVAMRLSGIPIEQVQKIGA